MPSPDVTRDDATIDDLLDRLADPGLSVDAAVVIMRSFDDHEAEAALPAFRRLHDSADPAMLHAMARLLGRWAERPVTRALVPALEALLAERAVGDLNKITAAGLLERLGQPVDYPRLLGKLHDLGAVAREMMSAMLDVADRPTAVLHALDGLAAMPPATVLAWIDDLGAGGDGRAVALLCPLTWVADADIAVAALASIDRLFRAGHERSGPDRAARRDAGLAGVALALAAGHHHDRAVRAQARITWRHVTRREGARDAPAVNRAPREDPLGRAAGWARRVLLRAAAASPAEVYASDPSGAGEQLALVVWPNVSPARTFDVLTLHVARERGIRHYAGIEHVGADAMAGLLDRLDDGGAPARRLPVAEAVGLLLAATVDTLDRGGAPAVGYGVWPQVLLGG